MVDVDGSDMVVMLVWSEMHLRGNDPNNYLINHRLRIFGCKTNAQHLKSLPTKENYYIATCYATLKLYATIS